MEDSDEDSETDLSEESEFEADLSSLETSSDDDNLTVEQKLENIIKKSITKFDLEYQHSAAVENLNKRSYHLFYILPPVTYLYILRIDGLDEVRDETEEKFKQVEREVDSLRRELYKDYEPERQELPSLDVINSEVEPVVKERLPPPSSGEIKRPPLSVGMKVLAMRHDLLQVWKEAVIAEEQVSRNDVKEYKVKFEGKNPPITKSHFSPSPYILVRNVGQQKKESIQNSDPEESRLFGSPSNSLDCQYSLCRTLQRQANPTWSLL